MSAAWGAIAALRPQLAACGDLPTCDSQHSVRSGLLPHVKRHLRPHTHSYSRTVTALDFDHARR